MESLEEVLAHHGIKGMKWGVRRSRAVLARQNSPHGVSEDAMKAKTAKSKVHKRSNADALSNQELQHLVTRMNLEKQLKSLQGPSKKQKGAKFVTDILVSAGKQSASTLVKSQLDAQIAAALNKKK
jgi:hypothetical protein